MQHIHDESTREGMASYAHEQATLCRQLSQNFAKLWSMPITEMGLYTLDDDGREDDDLILMLVEDEQAQPVVDIADLPDSDSDDLSLASDSDDDL